MADDLKRLFMGLAGEAAKVGVKAGLAAMDSAFGDAQRVVGGVERRIKRSRKKIAETAARIIVGEPVADEADEEE